MPRIPTTQTGLSQAGRRHSIPWTPSTFRKHNKDATAAELKIGVKEANRILTHGGSEGDAVRGGNAAILNYRINKARSRR